MEQLVVVELVMDIVLRINEIMSYAVQILPQWASVLSKSQVYYCCYYSVARRPPRARTSNLSPCIHREFVWCSNLDSEYISIPKITELQNYKNYCSKAYKVMSVGVPALPFFSVNKGCVLNSVKCVMWWRVLIWDSTVLWAAGRAQGASRKGR